MEQPAMISAEASTDDAKQLDYQQRRRHQVNE